MYSNPKSGNSAINKVLGGSRDTNAFYVYKAFKYHMKNQILLKQMLKEGKQIPDGYEKYLEKFPEVTDPYQLTEVVVSHV